MWTTDHDDEFLKVESDVGETLPRINAAFQVLKGIMPICRGQPVYSSERK